VVTAVATAVVVMEVMEAMAAVSLTPALARLTSTARPCQIRAVVLEELSARLSPILTAKLFLRASVDHSLEVEGEAAAAAVVLTVAEITTTVRAAVVAPEEIETGTETGAEMITASHFLVAILTAETAMEAVAHLLDMVVLLWEEVAGVVTRLGQADRRQRRRSNSRSRHLVLSD